MKRITWILPMVIAWLLIAGFGWECATNALILKDISARRNREQERLVQMQALRRSLDNEVLAAQADPFYIEKLARDKLRWGDAEEPTAEAAAENAVQERPIVRGGQIRAGGSNRAIFIIEPLEAAPETRDLPGPNVANRPPRNQAAFVN